MNKEEILLEALNTFGNFTTVSQEFNDNQLEVIYEAMELVKNNAVLPDVSVSSPKIHLDDKSIK